MSQSDLVKKLAKKLQVRLSIGHGSSEMFYKINHYEIAKEIEKALKVLDLELAQKA